MKMDLFMDENVSFYGWKCIFIWMKCFISWMKMCWFMDENCRGAGTAGRRAGARGECRNVGIWVETFVGACVDPDGRGISGGPAYGIYGVKTFLWMRLAIWHSWMKNVILWMRLALMDEKSIFYGKTNSSPLAHKIMWARKGPSAQSYIPDNTCPWMSSYGLDSWYWMCAVLQVNSGIM